MRRFSLADGCALIIERGDLTRCADDAVVNAANAITPGFELPARYVIHTVGPIYRRHLPDEAARLLARCHERSLALARQHGLKTVAFPAISCGAFGYPIEDAAEVALAACREHCEGLESVRFVHFTAATFDAWNDAAEALLSVSP